MQSPFPIISLPPYSELFLVGGSVVSIIYGGYLAFKRIRKSVLDAEQLKENEVERRISEAVDVERRRLLEAKEDESERIARLKELAEEWQNLATQKEEKIRQLSYQLGIAEKEIVDLKTKYQEMVKFNLELQAAIQEMRQEVSILTTRVNGKDE
jgi:hypothetical protein